MMNSESGSSAACFRHSSFIIHHSSFSSMRHDNRQPAVLRPRHSVLFTPYLLLHAAAQTIIPPSALVSRSLQSPSAFRGLVLQRVTTPRIARRACNRIAQGCRAAATLGKMWGQKTIPQRGFGDGSPPSEKPSPSCGRLAIERCEPQPVGAGIPLEPIGSTRIRANRATKPITNPRRLCSSLVL